ncbi:50S ribosomal protein L10 [Algiphilus sp.]|uniref:50S ribosomal protein L10 n=1 Tax=Algiphilus sp. TaxID=1872431 RepID=UPI001CA6A6EB|nr:50S ribosomal protein L10 [Algiphilus sp.]MBY8967183.1 50S ribosomal protein L10 [Algiphilus acroporae]MCI5062893.1 50S ribosomal protein L10 [Algiphilus sp.]MCI5104358.1 50S ribosomal protein L10 [Algiphilus sp.]
MAIRLHQKKALVAEVNEVAKKAHSAVAAEYIGLTAGQLDDLRAKAREGDIYLHVVKNTLAKRAVEGTEFECLSPSLVGPIMLGFSLEDPGSVARVIKDFAKTHPKLVVKTVAVGGTAYGPADLDRLASLPTREEALAMLMGTMKAPIGNFVRLLNEPTAKFVRTLSAVGESKQAA